MLFITVAYVFLGVFIWVIEKKRIRNTGPDFLFLFLFILFIQHVLPGAILTSIKSIFGPIDTGVPFFTKVLNDFGMYEAALVLILLCLFVFSLYFFWWLMNDTMAFNYNIPIVRLSVSSWRWFLVMVLGLVGMWVLIKELGGYNSLIIFRNSSFSTDRNFITANLFSLTTTFLLLSLVGIAMFWENKKSILFLFSLFCVITFALMTVSRRAFGIAVLLIFFSSVLYNKKFYINKKIAILFAGVFFPILIFGKNLLWRISNNQEITLDSSSGLLGNFTKMICDIGISTVESWATLLYLDIPMRFGVDHFLSVARRIPDGLLGLDIGFPERIVRISTEVFMGIDEQDIPPGFMGQMWLDFRLIGPVFAALVFCLIISFFQLFYNSIEKSRSAVMIFVVLVFIISYPIQTGTFDFVFNSENIALFMLVLFVVKIKHHKIYK